MPLVTSAEPGWTAKIEALPPGDHVAILTGTSATGIVGRLAGLELRDSLAVLLPGPDVGFVFIFRKPLEQPTVAAQTLLTGTGGLNIAGCRVGLSGGTKRSGQAQHLLKDDGTEDRSHHWARTGHTVVELDDTGRWPPNVLFVHGPRCRLGGTKQVKASNACGPAKSSRAHGNIYVQDDFTSFMGNGSRVSHGDGDGLETVPAWECEPRCPARILDRQTGDRPSTLTGRADPGKVYDNPGDNNGKSLFGAGNSFVYADSGGASRFYPQFADDVALLEWLATLVNATPPGG